MRYLLTRPAEANVVFARKLRRAGFQVVSLPLLKIKPPKDRYKKLAKKLSHPYDWLLLTSANAVKAVGPFLLKKKGTFKIAAVGPVTAAALKKYRLRAAFPKKSEGALALLQFFKNKKIKGKQFLYPASSLGRDVLKKGLEKRGGKVDVVEAYRTVPCLGVGKKLKKILRDGVDGVLFFSPSAVASFAKNLKGDSHGIQKISLIPFGKTTEQALRRFRFPVKRLPSLFR